MAEKTSHEFTEKVFKVVGDDTKVYMAFRSAAVRAVLASEKIKDLRKELSRKVKEQTEALHAEYAEKIKSVRKGIELVELSVAEVRRIPANVETVDLLVAKDETSQAGDADQDAATGDSQDVCNDACEGGF